MSCISWPTQHGAILYLYRSLIRSKLDYWCTICFHSKLVFMDALPCSEPLSSLCLGSYQKSPSSSLCALVNEHPLYLCSKRLSIQYFLKLSSNAQNLAYSGPLSPNLNPSSVANLTRFPLLVFECNLTCKP